jgi:hypothetical protein
MRRDPNGLERATGFDCVPQIHHRHAVSEKWCTSFFIATPACLEREDEHSLALALKRRTSVVCDG